jgi:hypothetical protein
VRRSGGVRLGKTGGAWFGMAPRESDLTRKTRELSQLCDSDTVFSADPRFRVPSRCLRAKM